MDRETDRGSRSIAGDGRACGHYYALGSGLRYWITPLRRHQVELPLQKPSNGSKMSFFVWPKTKHLPQLTILHLTALLATSSDSMAKSRKALQQRSEEPAAAVPEDPQAYAMRIARQTWSGRPLCDDGGYRIRVCDISNDLKTAPSGP